MPSTINASNSGSGGIVQTADASGVLQLQTAGTTALTIDTSQNVSVTNGTANGVTYLNGSKVVTSGSALTFDGSKLTVKGGNAGQFVLDNANEQYVQALFQRNATANTGADLLLDGSGNTFNFRTLAANMPFTWNISATAGAPSERMRLDASGNFMVGATSATYGATGRGVIEVNGGSTSIIGLKTNNVGSGYIYHDGGVMSVVNAKVDSLAFGTSGTERARIDSGGLFLIGTTSAFNSGYICTLNDATQRTPLAIKSSVSCANSYLIRFVNNSGTDVGAVVMNSANNGVNFTSLSDYRLKENIQPMTGALAKVAALKPCIYTWKDGGVSGQGFIAHELAEVVPDAVVGEKDAVNEDGSIKPQGISTSNLVATLTAAIKEQQALIESLTQRITALEGA